MFWGSYFNFKRKLQLISLHPYHIPAEDTCRLVITKSADSALRKINYNAHLIVLNFRTGKEMTLHKSSYFSHKSK